MPSAQQPSIRYFLRVVEISFLLWGESFAFVAVCRGRAELPSPSPKHRISNPTNRSDVSNDGLFAVRRENSPTDKRRRRRLPQRSDPSLTHPTPTRERESTVVIMYHKPPNVITSHSNADKVSNSAATGSQGNEGRVTVYDDIYSMKGFVPDRSSYANASFEEATQIKSKLHAIGRLDADTTGLLLLTNDGALVHKITNPNAKSNDENAPVQKTYEAVIMGQHSLPTQQSTSDYISISTSQKTTNSYPLQTLLDEGVALSAKHGGQTKPVDALSILSHPSRSTTHVSITISEGKNRQIRRMFHAIGSGVMKLHRVSVGRLTLHGLSHTKGQGVEDSGIMDGYLKEGQWRLLTKDEIRDGLSWECRCLDQFDTNTHKFERRASGRRNNQRNRRKVRRS